MKREDILIEMLSGEKRRVRLLLPEQVKDGEKVPVLEATEKVAQNKSDTNKRERRMQVVLNFSLFCCLFAGISCINLLSFIC